VIVYDFDFGGVAIGPSEAYSPLIINANGPLIGAIPSESFQSVAGRVSELFKALHLVKNEQLSQRDSLDLGG
jgi:hypothetical protein